MAATTDTIPAAVDVEGYRSYRRDGFLVVPGVLDEAEVEELLVAAARPAPGTGGAVALGDDRQEAGDDRPVQRVHMLHREQPVFERYLLHDRIVDVVAALTGPDVLALQTMLFLKPPGSAGQGWHQDSYYIPTLPDSLIGAWVALDEVDEDNGCLWVAAGSAVEPVYPDADGDARRGGDAGLRGITPIRGASDPDDARNDVAAVAAAYRDRWVPVPLHPGDMVVFHGHLLHRSYDNRSRTRARRSFVGHYCNARSAVPWDHDEPFEGELANGVHVLARGQTTLPAGAPRFR